MQTPIPVSSVKNSTNSTITPNYRGIYHQKSSTQIDTVVEKYFDFNAFHLDIKEDSTILCNLSKQFNDASKKQVFSNILKLKSY
jgi:hypothetical protein